MLIDKSYKFMLKVSSKFFAVLDSLTHYNYSTVQATMSRLLSSIFTGKEHDDSSDPPLFPKRIFKLKGKLPIPSDEEAAVALSSSPISPELRKQHIANFSIYLKGSPILRSVPVPHEKTEEFFISLLREGNVTAAKTYVQLKDLSCHSTN